MPRWIWTFTRSAALAAACVALSTSATNYSLWVKGRGAGGAPGNYADFSYWGPSNANAGVNKIAVNWDGSSSVAEQNPLVRQALDCYCTGENWCYVAAYSAGDLMIGYALAFYGGSTRYKMDARPDSTGHCTPLAGAANTQIGWNIKWVDVAAGAAGGTELANAGTWALSEPLVSDLRTTTARALYDHNITRGALFRMFAGARGTLYSGLLPGQDDEVIAYHSSGGVSGTSGSTLCNPRDWFCNDLTIGSGANQGGRAKWSNHSVVFRDDREDYSHYLGGNWGGVTSLMRADMATYAVRP